jgi:hypothetical protein
LFSLADDIFRVSLESNHTTERNMYPKHVIKLGTEKTPWGEVVVLLVDNQRTVAFPDFVGDSDRDYLDALYDTFEWPVGWPLNNMDQFPPGKPLAGWDILGAHRGRSFHDPAEENVIAETAPPSDAIRVADLSLQTAFYFAEKEIAKLNPPKQTRTKIQRLREIHARLFKRGTPHNKNSNPK